MIKKILGKKIRQSQWFTPEGERIPVTEIQTGPCYITHVDQNNRRVQLGFGLIKYVTKPLVGHLKKAGLTKKLRFFRSAPVDALDDSIRPGVEIKIGDVLAVGDMVTVSGVSKGKGFAGVVKRHHFRGGPRTHGQSDRERAPGSIGQTTTPGRVYKGKRMAGRMGGDRITIQGLSVVAIDRDKHLVKIKGLVPGPVNGLVELTKV
ncbi:50S ribosomal protein L3 [Candidatus Gottesmanbacteria bacterium RBG_16_43_7]|uniref:50S ribosomal protein L3 n=1 Tax=Candidatus Gottesmanbacteria bacterium RBG_16_43_7 TaxID=1798373 RepID=A0A1F5ZAD7_9BACT|nr:MAG: 50S ribosomal protein L3 [Candidatus Gottesmanbacteria bacterium RBG_16_43_7]